MAGYTRQSTADIIPTATVRAAPINAEYNALRDAFAASGGHKHDGTTGEGEYVPLIADLDANNKVQVNTGANTVDFYVEVSGVPVEQISLRDGVIRPITDDDIDLGATGAEFKDLYIDGIGYIDTLAVHENATVAGTLNVTGVITAPAGVVANITGNLTGNVTGDITGDVTGNLTGDVTSSGTSTFATANITTANITSGDIDSGAMDNTTIGGTTPAAGTFTTLNANTSLTAATADINGGTIDGATIGASSHTTGKFTTLQSTGQATLNTVDINGGNIDGTVIGAVGTAAGSFTTLSTSGQGTFATVDINGGTVDGTTIGASSASTGAFTTITASGGVTADVTGNLTGNVTGNVTGAITGNVTGDLTGNVTSAGTSTFNNVTIDGTLNMNAGTTATITNLTSPTNTNDAATKGYVDTQVSNLVDSAPGTLDTLNELAAALGDDPDFATTVTNSIATKLPLAGGTMTGAIAMSTNKITGAGDPTAAQDVATKAYTDTQRDTRVAKSGDTMSGNLAMGSNKITGLGTPVDNADASTKLYVDGLFGSSTAAASSAAAAATSETNAGTSETNASNSASAALGSQNAAAASYDSFDDRYLGAKSSAPTVDNDGDALLVGALYFNSTTNIMNVYGSGGWQSAGSAVNGTSDRQTYTATSGQTVFAATYDTGYVDVYLNGVKLVAGTDFTATNGTSITLATGATLNDTVDIVAYGTFVLADHYTEAQSDARYVEVAGDSMTGDLSFGDNDKAIFGAGSDLQIYSDGTTGQITGDVNLTGALTADNGSSTGQLNGNSLVFDRNSANYIRTSDAAGYLRIQTGSGDTAFFSANGDISFYEDTGTTPKFFWDASAESLGIGTSSPANLLHLYKASGGTYSIIENTSGKAAIGVGSGGEVTISAESASNPIRFLTSSGASEAMRIDSSGNVGIGTSSPATKLHIVDGSSGFAFLDSSGDAMFILDGANGDLAGGDYFTIQADSSPNLKITQAGTERMRIDSSGNLLVGTTSFAGSFNDPAGIYLSGQYDYLQAIRSGGAAAGFSRNSSDGSIVNFGKDGSTVGSIGTVLVPNREFAIKSNTGQLYCGVEGGSYYGVFDGDRMHPSADNAMDLGASGVRFKDLYLSGTANAANFNTTSDATLKTNVETLAGSLDAVKSLRGVSFDWLENGGSEIGFIAQEVEAVLPDVVSTNDEGIKSVKYGNMVAVLIEAIKEQQAQIDELKAKLNS